MISHIVQSTVINIIKAYQSILSPYLGGNCRFYPSCSEYAVLSITKDGVVRGIIKSAWRLLRCNPFSKGGIDYP